jgi:hypothetical protein
MEFGHVTRFLKAHPDPDRVLLLSEIASGMFPLLGDMCYSALRVH